MALNLNKNIGTEVEHKTQGRKFLGLIILFLVLLVIAIAMFAYYHSDKVEINQNPQQTSGTKELTPQQKEEIITNLKKQQATQPPITEKQKEEIIVNLKKQQAAQPTLTDAQKQEIIDNLKKNQ